MQLQVAHYFLLVGNAADSLRRDQCSAFVTIQVWVRGNLRFNATMTSRPFKANSSRNILL